MSGYDDFSLGFHLGSEGQIWVSASSRGGHVHGVTSVGPGRDVLADVFDELFDLFDAIRFAEPFNAAPITEALGMIAFGEPVVRELFQAARAAAADQSRQLIVRVQASPHLSALPWELLPDPSVAYGSAPGGLRHLTLAPDVHVARLSRGRTYPLTTAPLDPPLNLLVVLSSPMGDGPGDDSLTFDIYEAKQSLLEELSPLESAGWLNIDVEDQPTLDNLRRRVRSKHRGYHLLHYLGHAEPESLLLENERGRLRRVAGPELMNWLRTCPDLRLVTFAGCETARPGGDPTVADTTDWQTLLSLAERSAQGSSPVVLGMQAVLPFSTEKILTRSLYQGLASGNTVVDALRLAREAVRLNEQAPPGLLDWAIPALFMNSAEPAPLVERRGTPMPAARRRTNIVKIEPPATAMGLIGRDLPLRQAVEVLGGRNRGPRVLLISGSSGARCSELVDRALDEIDGQVTDILFVPYRTLQDQLEAAPFLANTEPTLERVVRANLCGAVSQLLQRSDGAARERRPEWTLGRWWAVLADDLAGRRATLAIHGMHVRAEMLPHLASLSRAWLENSFPAGQPDGGDSNRALMDFLERLRGPKEAKNTQKFKRLINAFDAFIGGPPADSITRDVLAEQAEDLLNERLGLPAADSRPVVAANEQTVARHRTDLDAVRGATNAVADMIVKVVHRAPNCRVALVVDEISDGMFDGLDDGLVFRMRLGEITWPEMWRWLHRSLPGLVRFGEDGLGAVWRKHLGSDLQRWEELERRVIDLRSLTREPSPDGGAEGIEDPQTAIEALAAQIVAKRTRRRHRAEPSPPAAARHRRDRPLFVAPGAAFADVAETQSPWHLTFAAFRDRLNALAEEHGIGGRVTTTAGEQQESLAALIPVESPFAATGGGSEDDLVKWYREIGKFRPDIVLLDFGGPTIMEREREARRKYLPAHQTLQIAAGGNDSSNAIVWPAWDEDVLAVGVLDENGGMAESASRSPQEKKPDIFSSDAFDPANPRRGSSYSAAHVVLAAILVWTLLPDLTPRRLCRFLVDVARPIERRTSAWPRAFSLDVAVAAARQERVVDTLQRGPASLQAIVAMTGLNWPRAELTLEELRRSQRVAIRPANRDVVYELLDV